VKGGSINVSPVLSGAIAPALDGGTCPHLAVLLRNEEEFAPVVASFYSLGAKRGGWLVHRGIEPDRDRQALAGAGLDVTGLEAERRLTLEQIKLTEPPGVLPRRLDAGFDDALERGMNTLWSSHTPVGPDSDSFAHAMEIERAWEEHLRDRPVVTLCPYIVGGLDAPATLGRLTGLGAGHDGVLVPSEQGVELFRPARAPDVP
jgi:MEDS: MEthanogen/methylotroph, DcmR Sensory domain